MAIIGKRTELDQFCSVRLASCVWLVCGWGEKVGEWGEEEREKGNCTYIPANMAEEEEVAKVIVSNDSGMCKASFAGDVPRMFSLIKNSFCV